MAFTTDGTSGVGIPQNSTEWGDAALSPYWPVPDHLWLCQELLGNLADSIGTMTLTKTGTPTFFNVVPGWSTRALHIELAISGTQGFSSTSNVIDIGSKSALWLMYVRVTGTPSTAAINILVFNNGASNVVQLVLNNTPKLDLRITNETGADVLGTKNPTSVVMPIVMQYDRTNQLFRAFTLQERIDCPYHPVGGPNTKGIGTVQSNGYSGPFDVLYMAEWNDANAELPDWKIRGGLNALNWSATSSFSVEYTASLSESVSESESVAESVVNIAGISDSFTESNTLAETMSAVAAPSDTDATTDSLSIVLASPLAIAESANVSDGSVAVMVSDVDSLADAPVLSDQLTAVTSVPIALAASASASESIAAGQVFHNALSAVTVSVAEAVVVGTGLPTIHAISPIPGVAPGTPGAFSGNYETAVGTEIIIKIFDDGENLVTESVVDGNSMMVFQNGAFFGRYVARSYLVFLSNGFELHILPSDNWQGTSVQLTCSATDTDGHLTSLMFSWQLPAVTAVQLPPRLLPPVVPAGQVDHVANALRLITDQFRSRL